MPSTASSATSLKGSSHCNSWALCICRSRGTNCHFNSHLNTAAEPRHWQWALWHFTWNFHRRNFCHAPSQSPTAFPQSLHVLLPCPVRWNFDTWMAGWLVTRLYNWWSLKIWRPGDMIRLQFFQAPLVKEIQRSQRVASFCQAEQWPPLNDTQSPEGMDVLSSVLVVFWATNGRRQLDHGGDWWIASSLRSYRNIEIYIYV